MARIEADGRIARPIRTAAAVILVAGRLDATVLLSQGYVDTICRTTDQSAAVAQFKSGLMYAASSAVPQDEAEAVRPYRPAADPDGVSETCNRSEKQIEK